MEKRIVIGRGVLFAAAALSAAYGCERPNPYKLQGDTSAVYEDCPTPSTGSGDGSTVATTGGNGATTGGNGSGATSGGNGSGATTGGSTGSGMVEEPVHTELDDRVLDYSEALRTASLLLVNDAPTLAQIYALADAPEADRPAKYQEMIDAMLADARFAKAMIGYFKYTFKMGGASTVMGEPTRDTAPNFAARVVFEEQPWTNILTAAANTCPTYSTVGGFQDGECTNLPMGMMHAGILTNPGVHSLYVGNLGFRRNRFFHETFLCRSGNEDSGGEPAGGNAPQDAPCPSDPMSMVAPGYNNKWPVSSIAGACNGGRVDFHAYNTTIICANCHSTWNHRAPLFAQFDSKGMWKAVNPDGTYQVQVPVDGSPFAKITDWLPDGQQQTAWKFGMPAANLTEMGTQMAGDDEVLECAVKRVWNYAMARGDTTTIGGGNWVDAPKHLPVLVKSFKEGNYNMKSVLRAVVLSDEFVRF